MSLNNNIQQGRPFAVRAGNNNNIQLTLGYQGAIVIDNAYYFSNDIFNSPLSVGEKILLYAQTDSTENGIWGVVSIVSGYVNVVKIKEYFNCFSVNPGEVVLLSEGIMLFNKITELEARLSALESKK